MRNKKKNQRAKCGLRAKLRNAQHNTYVDKNVWPDRSAIKTFGSEEAGGPRTSTEKLKGTSKLANLVLTEGRSIILSSNLSLSVRLRFV
jgi:hypothetical protein